MGPKFPEGDKTGSKKKAPIDKRDKNKQKQESDDGEEDFYGNNQKVK